MVKVKSGKKTYDYKNEVMTIAKIPRNLRDDIRKLFKKMKINQSKLIEELFRLILIRFKDGSLNATSGYLTINILRSPIKK